MSSWGTKASWCFCAAYCSIRWIIGSLIIWAFTTIAIQPVHLSPDPKLYVIGWLRTPTSKSNFRRTGCWTRLFTSTTTINLFRLMCSSRNCLRPTSLWCSWSLLHQSWFKLVTLQRFKARPSTGWACIWTQGWKHCSASSGGSHWSSWCARWRPIKGWCRISLSLCFIGSFSLHSAWLFCSQSAQNTGHRECLLTNSRGRLQPPFWSMTPLTYLKRSLSCSCAAWCCHSQRRPSRNARSFSNFSSTVSW